MIWRVASLFTLIVLSSNSIQAQKKHKQQIQRDSIASELHCKSAIKWFENGKFELALAELDSAELLSRQNCKIYHVRGIVYFNKNEFAIAAVALVGVQNRVGCGARTGTRIKN